MPRYGGRLEGNCVPIVGTSIAFREVSSYGKLLFLSFRTLNLKIDILRKIITIGLTLLAAGLYCHALYDLVVLSFKVPLLSHVLLIPLVTLYLFWIKRKAIFSKLEYAPSLGTAMLVSSLAVAACGRWQLFHLSQNDALFVFTSSLVLWIWGGFLSVCGRQAFVKALFPLFFLTFMIPLPSWVLEPVVRFLQLGSTYSAQAIFRVFDVPAYFEGVSIALPGATIEVAEECSGIRSGLALVIICTVGAYLFLNSNWRRMCLVACAIPVTVIKNGMRVATLALLGAYVDMSYLTDSALHSQGGKPFLLVAVLMMLPIFCMLRRSERIAAGNAKEDSQSGKANDSSGAS